MNKRIYGYLEAKDIDTHKGGYAWALDNNGMVKRVAMDNDVIRYGFEVETQHKGLTRAIVEGRDVQGFDDTLINEAFILSSDASLHKEGFEIVSGVMDKDASLELFKSSDVQAILKSSYDSGSNGIHIHASKTAYFDDQVHIKRAMVLIYKLGKTMEALTRSSGYAEWFHKGEGLDMFNLVISADEFRSARAVREMCYHSNRYHALNFSNDHTVEFRFFNYTDDPKRFAKYLNFVESFMTIIFDHTLIHIENRAWKLDSETWTIY